MVKKFEQKHPSYLSVSSGKDGARKKSGVFARKRREVAPSHPDPQQPLITGRYQDVDGSCTIMINQAGTHMECWYALVEPSDGTSTKYWAHWGGDLQPGSSDFELYEHSKGERKAVGVLQVSGERLLLHARGELVRLELMTSRPTLSEGAIRSMPGSDEDRSFLLHCERFPLTRQYIQWLNGRLVEKLAPLLERYFAVEMTGTRIGDRVERLALAKRIDQHVEDTFSTKVGSGWNPSDVSLAQLYGRFIIRSQAWSWKGDIRPIEEWLRLVAQRCSIDRLVGTQGEIVLRSLYVHLKVRASKNLFNYEVELVVGGASVDIGLGLSFWMGRITIKKFPYVQNADGKWVNGPLSWSQGYPLYIAGGSLGYSVGFSVALESSGSGISEIEYQPEELVGSFYTYDVNLTAVAWAVGPSIMVIRGDTISLPSLVINMSGVTTKYGLAGGGEGGATVGVIGDVDTKTVRSDSLQMDFHYSDMEGATACHFRLGDSFLTDEGREHVRRVAALELALFGSEYSVLKIDGHADRIDERERNIELSQFRARNTLQALRDVLGSQFRIREENIVIRGLGEHEAEAEGQPDGKGDPVKRRVDVRIEGRVILSLLGE